MKKPRYTVIPADPYNTSVIVYLGGEFKACADHFAGEVGWVGPPLGEDTVPAHGRFVRLSDIRDSFIWLPEIPQTCRELGTLSHELCHATFHILCRADIPLLLSDNVGGLGYEDEVFCYLQGHLLKTALDRMNGKATIKKWFLSLKSK